MNLHVYRMNLNYFLDVESNRTLTDRRKMGEMGDRGGGCPKTAFLFATKPSFALNSTSSSKL